MTTSKGIAPLTVCCATARAAALFELIEIIFMTSSVVSWLLPTRVGAVKIAMLSSPAQMPTGRPQ